ncbi:MAG: transposase [Burkholderiales bacterium]
MIQRGKNRESCFFADEDYRFYLLCLQKGATRYQCAIHAYVLMTNHVHLLVNPGTEDGLSLMMRYVGSRYVQYVNYVYSRTGTLWEGRFRSNPIESERYLLACYRYIESNPVRARIVETPAKYPWSSYAHHAEGRENKVIQDHPIYVALGSTPWERQHAYRDLFRQPMDDKELEEIRASVNAGLVLGGDRFKDVIEQAVARPVRPAKGGRPRKADGRRAVT